MVRDLAYETYMYSSRNLKRKTRIGIFISETASGFLQKRKEDFVLSLICSHILRGVGGKA